MSGPAAVVVGASAGGVEALRVFAAGLPADLDATVLVVLHLPSDAHSRLADIIGKAGPLPAAPAESGEPLRPGRIVVARPDHHLLVHDTSVLLSCGASENGHRPAVDPLFRSAARWLGVRAVGVVLSGVLDDGAAGCAALLSQGGGVVVQDPGEALFGGMPLAALRAAPEALRLPAARIGARLPDLLSRSRTGTAPSADLVLETDMMEMDEAAVSGVSSPGRPVSVSCPSCHGAMSEVRTGPALHYRCHVGHAYGPQSLLAAQAEASESALWTAIASMEERAAVHRELAELPSGREHREEHLRQSDEVSAQARALRRQLRSQVGRT